MTESVEVSGGRGITHKMRKLKIEKEQNSNKQEGKLQKLFEKIRNFNTSCVTRFYYFKALLIKKTKVPLKYFKILSEELIINLSPNKNYY